MTSETAILRLKKRLSPKQSIVPNNKDLEALNHIIESFNSREERILHDKNFNLFVKMYALTLSFSTSINNTNLLNPNSRIPIHDALRKPLSFCYEEIAQDLNDFERNEFLNSKGINLNKHPALKTLKENEAENKIIKNICKNPNDLNNLFKNPWTAQAVEDKLLPEALEVYKIAMGQFN
jgi:hypothetical protein